MGNSGLRTVSCAIPLSPFSFPVANQQTKFLLGCQLYNGTSFTFFDFQLLRMNQEMREIMGREGMTFDILDRLTDDDGNPLLYWHMLYYSVGDAIVDVYGWAKKRREEESGVPAVLSPAELERIEVYDDAMSRS
jgi:hypothetical protein